jgi:hypothetical protein
VFETILLPYQKAITNAFTIKVQKIIACYLQLPAIFEHVVHAQGL